jgi:hypothetical protein
VALPGLMLVHFIKRKRLEYEAFLARLESYTIQYFKKHFTATQSGEDTMFFRSPQAKAVAQSKSS